MKHIMEVKRMNEIKNDARSSDMFLSYPNTEEFIKQSIVQTITSWISSSQKAIIKIIKKWKGSSQQGTKSILTWIQR